MALFIRFERDILADDAQVIGRDAGKRGEIKRDGSYSISRIKMLIMNNVTQI